MNVKSVDVTQDFVDLSMEIPLFENDTSWNFMDVLETHETNFEYFNDVPDKDFQKLTMFEKVKSISPMLSLVVIMVTCMFVGINSSGLLKTDKDYEEVKSAVSVEARGSTRRVSGERCTNDDKSEASKVLHDYFSVLKGGKGYDDLSKMTSTTSTFAATYNEFKNGMEHAYDINDSYARALSLFGKSCDVDTVNDMVYSDGVYYCYVSIKMPTVSTVGEYIYENQQNLVKWFKSNDVCQENMIRFLENTVSVKPLGVSQDEYCIRFEKKDDAFLIQDDSPVTSTCVEGYTVALSKMSGILSGSLTN